jgi:hypothetical protein
LDVSEFEKAPNATGPSRILGWNSKERWPGDGEKVSSERILTQDVLPSQFILSIEDMEKKTTLYQ